MLRSDAERVQREVAGSRIDEPRGVNLDAGHLRRFGALERRRPSSPAKARGEPLRNRKRMSDRGTARLWPLPRSCLSPVAALHLLEASAKIVRNVTAQCGRGGRIRGPTWEMRRRRVLPTSA
jgi:hypothetical protein